MKYHLYDAGNLTKMAIVSMCGKHFKNRLSRNEVSMELVMKHRRLKPFLFCSIENPRLTMTYFTAT